MNANFLTGIAMAALVLVLAGCGQAGAPTQDHGLAHDQG